MKKSLTAVIISDTHGMFDQLKIPDGDILIHSGDILRAGTIDEVKKFNIWIGELPHTYKIVIAGNHDRCFEHAPLKCREVLTNATYLQDESITIEGINFYGSPWQPEFCNWSFNLPRNGKEIEDIWKAIPSNTDVLITHGPPFGVLDMTDLGVRAGCEVLTKELERIKPKYHIFGHIHEGYGIVNRNDTVYINASSLTSRYIPSNDPIEILLEV